MSDVRNASIVSTSPRINATSTIQSLHPLHDLRGTKHAASILESNHHRLPKIISGTFGALVLLFIILAATLTVRRKWAKSQTFDDVDAYADCEESRKSPLDVAELARAKTSQEASESSLDSKAEPKIALTNVQGSDPGRRDSQLSRLSSGDAIQSQWLARTASSVPSEYLFLDPDHRSSVSCDDSVSIVAAQQSRVIAKI